MCWKNETKLSKKPIQREIRVMDRFEWNTCEIIHAFSYKDDTKKRYGERGLNLEGFNMYIPRWFADIKLIFIMMSYYHMLQLTPKLNGSPIYSLLPFIHFPIMRGEIPSYHHFIYGIFFKISWKHWNTTIDTSPREPSS